MTFMQLPRQSQYHREFIELVELSESVSQTVCLVSAACHMTQPRIRIRIRIQSGEKHLPNIITRPVFPLFPALQIEFMANKLAKA